MLIPLLCVSLCGVAVARPHPMTRQIAATLPYGHALRIEAQREAFWRSHRHGRDVGAQEDMTDPATRLRHQQYWSSQIRGRAMCQAYGGCS